MKLGNNASRDPTYKHPDLCLNSEVT